ncbi:MAG: small-conductance mechanosensitive channel [Saprospiraceae bacterium]|jgi:small-conductance mechanosensitive channel
MLNKIFDFVLFPIGALQFTVGQLIALLFLFFVASVLWRLTKAKWRIAFFAKNEVEPDNRRRFERLLRQLVILITTFLAIRLLGLDFELYNSGSGGSSGSIVLRYSIVIVALIILVLAWLTEWLFSNVLIHKYEKDRREDVSQNLTDTYEDVRTKIIRLVQYIVIVLAAMAIINNFGLDYEIIPYKNEDKISTFIGPNKVLIIVLIFLLARMLSWILTQVALYSIFKKREVDQGTRFAINQLLQYVIYVIAVYLALKSLDINMTLILGGAAALLVGIGLGLQQTFNDFFSGLVLLFERSVSVGDILDLNGQVGAVKKIGLRSSIIETRGNISFIVPNSKLVNDNVQNWSHFVDHGRFHVDVGVAYGSDTSQVKKLLLEAVNDHHLTLDYPVPFVRFGEFADSSLNFSVFFFTNRFLIVEDIKSDIRFKIDKAFRANNVSIPFPQRDVWMRKVEEE